MSLKSIALIGVRKYFFCFIFHVLGRCSLDPTNSSSKASGNFGGLLVPELVKTDLNITAVIRESSKATFPSSVQVTKSDFSLKSLTEAFEGKDAVVSMLPIDAAADQAVLIEAAIAAGVKRFLPSEYGSDSAVRNCSVEACSA